VFLSTGLGMAASGATSTGMFSLSVRACRIRENRLGSLLRVLFNVQSPHKFGFDSWQSVYAIRLAFLFLVHAANSLAWFRRPVDFDYMFF
jgi:hypothetical protein